MVVAGAAGRGLSGAIRLLRVSGTHREVGRQVGFATAEVVRRAVDVPFESALIERYYATTARYLPWVLEELEGVAEGAGVDPFAVVASSVVELETASPYPPGRCTDLVAMPGVTATGHLLVAHNNDYTPASEPDYVAIEWRVPGEPVCFTVGLGPWLAVGWNDAGLSVTVNELAPKDGRVGIPRVLQLRDVVTRTTIEDALESVLHPERASSYNWVLAHRDGRAVNVEGGASRAEIIEPERGVLAHTNHYTHPAMLDLESSNSIAGSVARLHRAQELLGLHREPWTANALLAVLSDHGNAPDSLCRHGKDDLARTVFWCVADVTAGSIRYGSGPPCISDPMLYQLPQ